MKIIVNDPIGWFTSSLRATPLLFSKIEQDWDFIAADLSNVFRCKLGYIAISSGNEWFTINRDTEVGKVIHGVEPGDVLCVVELSI